MKRRSEKNDGGGGGGGVSKCEVCVKSAFSAAARIHVSTYLLDSLKYMKYIYIRSTFFRYVCNISASHFSE